MLEPLFRLFSFFFFSSFVVCTHARKCMKKRWKIAKREYSFLQFRLSRSEIFTIHNNNRNYHYCCVHARVSHFAVAISLTFAILFHSSVLLLFMCVCPYALIFLSWHQHSLSIFEIASVLLKRDIEKQSTRIHSHTEGENEREQQ